MTCQPFSADLTLIQTLKADKKTPISRKFFEINKKLLALSLRLRYAEVGNYINFCERKNYEFEN